MRSSGTSSDTGSHWNDDQSPSDGLDKKHRVEQQAEASKGRGGDEDGEELDVEAIF